MGSPLTQSVLWPFGLVIIGLVAWHQWGSDHVANQYHGIVPERIHISQPPSYVRSDVVQAVYRDTAMQGLSLLDRQATVKIASAFSMHPWVRKVVGVRKLAGGEIDVRLEYRTPVAMVHVFKPDLSDARSYFFPVDGEGVLLPTGEFTTAETRNYLYIEVPGVYTTNPVGSNFGDVRVEAAAQLAEYLSPFRDEIEIRSIGVYGDPRQMQVPQLELVTPDERRIYWGSPPGSEPPGEATAKMKLQRLKKSDPDQLSDLRIATPVFPSSRL
ncbi:hypothetical protein OAE79_01905 [Rhodopirellula sp.]|jgi:hypothetical protein|nr:hypothetical protein [Rhodopirellula sp.]MDB4679070.1 hypothetical protein [Rhodopirellula sp.]